MGWRVRCGGRIIASGFAEYADASAWLDAYTNAADEFERATSTKD